MYPAAQSEIIPKPATSREPRPAWPLAVRSISGRIPYIALQLLRWASEESGTRLTCAHSWVIWVRLDASPAGK